MFMSTSFHISVYTYMHNTRMISRKVFLTESTAITSIDRNQGVSTHGFFSFVRICT